MPANLGSPLPKYLLEDEAAEKRNAAFLSSLPKEKDSDSTYLYSYQGCWMAPAHLEGVLAFQKHFQARDLDVFVVTSPKCGTTWLKALVFATTTRKHYTSVKITEHPLLVRNPHDLVPYIDFQIYAENENPDLSSSQNPRLFSTHLPYVSLPQSVKNSGCKIVYLRRNPKDTFVSYWRFENKLMLQLCNIPLDEEFERFCKGVTPFGPYWDHVLGYWEKSLEMSENLFFFKFEDLKENPLLYLKKLANFLGCPFSLKEEASGVPEEILRLCSFDNLSNLEVNKNGKLSTGEENKVFFRNGKVGGWKNFLTAEMVKGLDNLAKEKIQASGLEF